MNDKRGLLMVWTDVPAEVEPDFNEWYNREHVPDRINKVPGFTRARRFAAISGAPKYLALYETRSAEVFRSEPYLAINKSPDPNSRRFIPLFRNTIKGICNVVLRTGEGEGSFLALLPTGTAAGRISEFREWVCNFLLPDIVRSRDVVAATFAEHHEEIQEIAAANYTRAGDRYLDSLIEIEATSEAGLATAVSRLDPIILALHGGTAPIMKHASTFRVLYTLHA
jgi:hypothetical protein